MDELLLDQYKEACVIMANGDIYVFKKRYINILVDVITQASNYSDRVVEKSVQAEVGKHLSYRYYTTNGIVDVKTQDIISSIEYS